MSWTYVNSWSAISNGQDTTLAVSPTGVTVGNTLVAVVTASTVVSTPLAVTISDGVNTYVSCATADPSEGPTIYFYTFKGWYSKVTTGGALTVTINSATSFLSLSVAEWSTTQPYASLDSIPTSAAFSSVPASPGPFAITGNDLVMSAYMQFNVNSTLWTPGAGATAIQNTFNVGSVQQGILVQYQANITRGPVNPNATLAGALGACFGFALRQSASVPNAANLNYHISKNGLLNLVLTNPAVSITGAHGQQFVSSVTADPTVQVNGHTVTIDKAWSDASQFWAFVDYYLRCGKVSYISMSAGGHTYTSSVTAAWSGSSGGGTSLVLGTPVRASGVTSYTIVSPGSGMTNGTYQWLIATQGTGCSAATAWVTVSSGAVASIVPICGSAFGMGANYTGSTISGMSFNLAGGSPATITANISNYVQSVPVTSSSADFTSQPTITITDSGGGTGAVAAPIMSGPSNTDVITMSLAGGAIGCVLGTTPALSGVTVRNDVGIVEPAFGDVPGLDVTPVSPYGGEVGSEQLGGVASLMLIKNVMASAGIWAGGGVTLDSNGFPLTGTVGQITKIQAYTSGILWSPSPTGHWILIYNDAHYGGGAPPGPTNHYVTTQSGSNCTVTQVGSYVVSGTQVTSLWDVQYTANPPTMDLNLYVNFVWPSDGLYHITNLRFMRPGNTDTYLTNPYDVDDNVVANLTSGGTTVGVLRGMETTLSAAAQTNIQLITDIPNYAAKQSWVLPQLYTSAITVSSIRRLNTDPGSGTYSWHSTKLYLQGTDLPTLSDGFGNYIDLTAGPAGVNDNGAFINHVPTSSPQFLICMEIVCATPHGFRTGDFITIGGADPGTNVTTDQSGVVNLFYSAYGNPDYIAYVTGATTFVIQYYANYVVGGSSVQKLVDTSPVAAVGVTCHVNQPFTIGGSPIQFMANFVSRLPGCAFWCTLPQLGTVSMLQAWMDLISPYFLSTNNEIWFETADEPWNNSWTIYNLLYNIQNWTQYVPNSSSCYQGFYTSSTSAGVSSQPAMYAILSGARMKIAHDRLVANGISSTRIRFMYGINYGDSSNAAIVANAINTLILPTPATICPNNYTGLEADPPQDITPSRAFQPAGFPGGAGNWPVWALGDLIRHALTQAPAANAAISSVKAAIGSLEVGAYEGGVTSPVPTDVIDYQLIGEDISNHPVWGDIQHAFLAWEQTGDPTYPGAFFSRGSIFTIWSTDFNPVSPGQPFWRLAEGPSMPNGSGTGNLFVTPQGGAGSDGSRISGYANVNQATGIKPLLDWQAGRSPTPTPTPTSTAAVPAAVLIGL